MRLRIALCLAPLVIAASACGQSSVKSSVDVTVTGSDRHLVAHVSSVRWPHCNSVDAQLNGHTVRRNVVVTGGNFSVNIPAMAGDDLSITSSCDESGTTHQDNWATLIQAP
jgi:hypothetical protein